MRNPSEFRCKLSHVNFTMKYCHSTRYFSLLNFTYYLFTRIHTNIYIYKAGRHPKIIFDIMSVIILPQCIYVNFFDTVSATFQPMTNTFYASVCS